MSSAYSLEFPMDVCYIGRMNREHASTLQDFRQVQQHPIVFPLPTDLLTIQGGEAIDFLNRLSTNDVRQLAPSELCTTILTTEKARIIDIISILPQGQDYLLITSPGNAEKVIAWLEKFIIMEQLQISRVTSDFSRLCFIGDDAGSRLESILSLELPSDDRRFSSIPYHNSNIILYRDPLWPGQTWNALGSPDAIAGLYENCCSKGEGEGFRSVGTGEIETIRIENGVPALDLELTDQVNPLEANLEKFVSFTKGCYIGQEVIARIDSYKKLQKKLTGFVLHSAERGVILPGTLLSNDVEVGWTTSHAWSNKLNKQIALGYLKTTVGDFTLQFRLKNAGAEIPASVSRLPFQS